MVDLRKHAEGKPCLIRIPGGCVGDTVLCHIRMIGISGAGMKAPDLLAAWGCNRCHDIVDGRQASNFTASDRRMMLLEGMARTQNQLIKEGIL